MNPFVNPKKRGFLLPSGCKDLADVLRLRTGKTEDPVRVFTRLMLLQAEEVEASEVLIPAPMVHDGECQITQRIGGFLYHVSAIPAKWRSDVVTELLRMAALPEGQFPAEGTAVLTLKARVLKWTIRIESADADCVLTPSDE